MVMSSSAIESTLDTLPIEVPIVVDLGKAKRKEIRALKKGRGKLVKDVVAAVNEIVVNLGDDMTGKKLVPVVLVYRKKRKKRKKGLRFPFFTR